MDISKSVENNVLTFKISGRLDTVTAPSLEAAVKEAVTPETSGMVFDMNDLEYTSSAGLRVILMSHKLMSKTAEGFKLINVSADVREVLDMTGFLDILTIE